MSLEKARLPNLKDKVEGIGKDKGKAQEKPKARSKVYKSKK